MAISPAPAPAPLTQNYASPNASSYYPPQPQPQPIRQSHHNPPVEAPIQSWADNVAQQQPKPMTPLAAPVANMQGTWMPGMGIKFGPSPSGGANPNEQQGSGNAQPVKGTWEPSKGIRFG